jgi:hypothetical protein
LLSSLAAITSTVDYSVTPHHPINCLEASELKYFEDGSFSCPHAKVPPEDPRMKNALNASIAMLIIELASKI